MNMLHLFAEKPNELAVRIMDIQSRDHEIKVVRLREGDVLYEDVVDEIFIADRVISWNG